MPKPWTDGPRELLQHAVDHLAEDGDFDRRIAMISIDNAVELMVKTHLGLPRRARGDDGPSRKELQEASESFPALLDLLDKHDSDKITGLNLDDIEWYHRIRNQLYHSGNGITVETSKVEAYLQLAQSLFQNLFGEPVPLDASGPLKTKTGEFLLLWNEFQGELREKLPPREQGKPAFFWKSEHLKMIDPSLPPLYEALSMFRNALVHGVDTPAPEILDTRIRALRELIKKVKR
jgi:hypothetical protein